MSERKLSNPHIEALEPYQSARRIGGSGEVWLNANESPFPRRPQPMDVSEYHRYPDRGPGEVEAAYARYAGVTAEQVLALRGADEAIDLLVRGYCRAGQDKVLISSPTYGMYEICARIQDAGVVDVPLTEDFQLDVAAICARDDVSVVFLCHPNNPSGNALRRTDLEAIVERFAGEALVVVDEAYIEFSPAQSLVPLLAAHEHLVVVRTLSKAFGLAGVHVGFLLAGAAVMDTMLKVVAPYPLADPCAQIALRALSSDGIALMRSEVAASTAVRETFAAELAGLPAVTATLASTTNFVTAAFRAPDQAWEALLEDGIVARRLPHPRLAQSIRFSVGTQEEMERVLGVLRALSQGPH